MLRLGRWRCAVCAGLRHPLRRRGRARPEEPLQRSDRPQPAVRQQGVRNRGESSKLLGRLLMGSGSEPRAEPAPRGPPTGSAVTAALSTGPCVVCCPFAHAVAGGPGSPFNRVRLRSARLRSAANRIRTWRSTAMHPSRVLCKCQAARGSSRFLASVACIICTQGPHEPVRRVCRRHRLPEGHGAASAADVDDGGHAARSLAWRRLQLSKSRRRASRTVREGRKSVRSRLT